MKRTALILTGMAVLCVGIYATSGLKAQTTGGGVAPSGAATAAPKTRIALLNLTYVVKNYKKFTAYQEELKRTVDPFQQQDATHKANGEKLAKEAALATTLPPRREAIEKELKDLQRRIEDNKNDAQKVLVKKQEEQLKTLYMDVRGVVEQQAQTYGYEMVLHYNDAVAYDDYWSPPNIARKMQAGALMPIYISKGLDISEHVAATLNAKYGGSAPATGATGATGGVARPAGN